MKLTWSVLVKQQELTTALYQSWECSPFEAPFPLTLSGVDEKPQNEAPVRTTYRGFLFYSLLTEPGATIGCKVAAFTMSLPAAISTSAL